MDPLPDLLDEAAALDLLAHGELTVRGRLLGASNVTLLVTVSVPEVSVPEVSAQGASAHAVYKPVRGEAPLWDFPTGTLAARERAAYVVSEALGWRVVPPTVLRDGPYGPGMVQLWIEPEEIADEDLLGLVRSTTSAPLRRVALFDAVVNNADRKGGHLIPVPGPASVGTGRSVTHVYGVDHGVCFHVEDKLRTVLWQWRGGPLADSEADALARLATALEGDVGAELDDLLNHDEVARTRERVASLVEGRTFPFPSPGWPAVPWPPW